jgi:hypothetical protein
MGLEGFKNTMWFSKPCQATIAESSANVTPLIPELARTLSLIRPGRFLVGMSLIRTRQFFAMFSSVNLRLNHIIFFWLCWYSTSGQVLFIIFLRETHLCCTIGVWAYCQEPKTDLPVHHDQRSKGTASFIDWTGVIDAQQSIVDVTHK